MKYKKSLLALAVAFALPQAAIAAETTEATSFSEAITDGKVSGMFRLRYENVNQDNPLKDANALTLRSLIGYETKPFYNISAKFDVYALTPFIDDYNDAKKGSPTASRKQYSVIADPEDYDFHQAYIQLANETNKVKAGRQNMILDNWRFVGDVRFRQNWAVFNGISYENTALPNTKITLAHFEQIKQVTTKIRDISTEIVNVSYKINPTNTLTGYGYFIEWEDPALAAASTKTFGLRFDGKTKINDGLTALYTAEYAKQDDYKKAQDIDNHYYLASGGFAYKGWAVRLNHEVLSGTYSKSVKSFQTPFGTNHKFQGWADLFLATPAPGIEDTFLTVSGKVMGAKVKAAYHVINAEKDVAAGDKYGTEFDLGVYYKFKNKVIGAVEYANFNQKDSGLGVPDTEKFWLTAIYKF